MSLLHYSEKFTAQQRAQLQYRPGDKVVCVVQHIGRNLLQYEVYQVYAESPDGTRIRLKELRFPWFDKTRFEPYIEPEKLEPRHSSAAEVRARMVEQQRFLEDYCNQDVLYYAEIYNKLFDQVFPLPDTILTPSPRPGFIDMTPAPPAEAPLRKRRIHPDANVSSAIAALHASRPCNGLPYDYLDLAKLENRRPHRKP